MLACILEMNKTSVILTFSLLLLSLTFTVFAWIENTYQIDFLISKSDHYLNRWRSDIETSQDTEHLREKALEYLDSVKEIKAARTMHGNKILTLLLFSAATSFLALIICSIAILKRKRHANSG